MMFTLDKMKNELKDTPEIRFQAQPNGTTVACYMVNDQDTFDNPIAREARGITFDSTGKIIGRPLHKFFNVNERPETLMDNINFKDVTRIMLKRDGSMIHTVAIKNGVLNFDMKSKSTFDSDVANMARVWLLNRSNYVKFCESIVYFGYTAIFEWTSPKARIVVDYPHDELVLLHIRNTQTGEYMEESALRKYAASFDIPVVDSVNIDPSTLPELCNTVEKIEGWVLQFNNGDMVKLKTQWYLDRHHAMTALRPRDIARMVLDECLDDLKSKIVGDGLSIDPILEIEHDVVHKLKALDIQVEMWYTFNHDTDRKTVAMMHKDDPLFGLYMARYSGKYVDLKEYFRKNLLRSYGLETIRIVETVVEN